jgi:hypothetical protein
MPLVHPRPLSPRQMAANRLNARKSTGPRTAAGKRRVALNALKHACDARRESAFRSVMARLGEDPAEFDRLVENLRRVWHPSDPLQELLVRDLARLYWQKLRAERVREEALTREFRRADAECQRKLEQSARPSPLLDEFNIQFFGYRHVDDCPEKFQKCAKLFAKLAEHVEKRDWSDQIPTLLKSLYGDARGTMGERITKLVSRFLNPELAGAEAETEEETYEELRALLARDQEELQRQKEAYERQPLDSDAAERARARAEFERFAAQEDGGTAAFDRRIGGKIRLLILLKRAHGASWSVRAKRAANQEKLQRTSRPPSRNFRGRRIPLNGTKPPGSIESSTSLQKQTQSDPA